MGMPTGRRLSIATLDRDAEPLICHLLNCGGLIIDPSRGLHVTDQFKVRFQNGEAQAFNFIFLDNLKPGEDVVDRYTMSRTISVLFRGVWQYSSCNVLYLGLVSLAPWTADMKTRWQAVEKWVTSNFHKYRVKTSAKDLVRVGPEAMRWKELDDNYISGDWDKLPSNDIVPLYPSRMGRDCHGEILSPPGRSEP